MARSPTAAATALRWFLRVVGTSSLTALVFVAAPRAWMASIHADLGLGPLPDAPVVGYLARSTSAFYALTGALMWVVSFDLVRHARVLTFLGAASVTMGGMLLAVDWWEGMPVFWTLWEGPIVVVFGVAMLLLTRRVAREAGGVRASFFAGPNSGDGARSG